MATQLLKSDGVVWEELDGEALLIDAAGTSAWVLNASATHIWKHGDYCGIHAIVKELARAGQRSVRQVEGDVCAFIAALDARGLLKHQPELMALQPICPAVAFHGSYQAPAFQPKALGGGPRRRPSPRGNSGPG